MKIFLSDNNCLSISIFLDQKMLQGLGKQMGIQDLLTVLCVEEEFSYSYPNTQKDTRNISVFSLFARKGAAKFKAWTQHHCNALSRNSLEFWRVSESCQFDLTFENTKLFCELKSLLSACFQNICNLWISVGGVWQEGLQLRLSEISKTHRLKTFLSSSF